jgi:peptidoglycan/LPS O-acetylase OafA/YrhL
MVLVFHQVCITMVPAPGGALALVQKMLRLGSGGVELFFVLSGMLITGILLDHRDATNYFRVFYLRRVSRILPLYFVVIGGFALATTTRLAADARYGYLFAHRLPLWCYATFTQNLVMGLRHDWGSYALSPTWTLSVEEQFYLLIPLFVRFVPRPVAFVVVIGALASVPILRVALPGFHTDMVTPFRADPLLFGVLLAMTLRSPRAKAVAVRHKLALERLLFALVAGAVASTLLPNLLGPFTFFVMGGLCFLLILVVAIDAQGRVSRFFQSPFLVWCGLASYGLYLFHEIVNGALHASLLGRAPRLDSVASVGVTLLSWTTIALLAGLSYRYFERPILDRAHRVPYHADPFGRRL